MTYCVSLVHQVDETVGSNCSMHLVNQTATIVNLLIMPYLLNRGQTNTEIEQNHILFLGSRYILFL